MSIAESPEAPTEDRDAPARYDPVYRACKILTVLSVRGESGIWDIAIACGYGLQDTRGLLRSLVQSGFVAERSARGASRWRLGADVRTVALGYVATTCREDDDGE